MLRIYELTSLLGLVILWLLAALIGGNSSLIEDLADLSASIDYNKDEMIGQIDVLRLRKSEGRK